MFILRRDYRWVLLLQVFLRFFFFCFWPFDDLEVFNMVDFEDDGRDGVFVGLDLVFPISATLRPERSHVLKIHASFSPIDFNKGALVADLGIGDEADHAPRQVVCLLGFVWARHFLIINTLLFGCSNSFVGERFDDCFKKAFSKIYSKNND